MTERKPVNLSPEEIQKLKKERARLQAELDAEEEPSTTQAVADVVPDKKLTTEEEKTPPPPTQQPTEESLGEKNKKQTEKLTDEIIELVKKIYDQQAKLKELESSEPVDRKKVLSARKELKAFKKDKKKLMQERNRLGWKGVGEEITQPEELLTPDDAVAREREVLVGNTEVRKTQEEIAQLPKEEKKKLAVGLSTIGFVVEKKKNDFFAGVFGGIAKILPKGKKEGTVSKFCKELRDSFVRDADTAHKKAKEVKEGKQKRGVENASRLFGNLIRYGRTITDLTGASLASPLRYVMMGGMAFTRGAEAAKETRLKNEEVMEKTRIADAERAAEEAWKIYEHAQQEAGGAENISSEQLKEAYLMQIPEDIKKRLENTSVANEFLQKTFRKDLESSMKRILAQIDKIQKNENLSATEKKTAEKKLIKKYEEKLKDFDRILTQYGTVDELAMAGRYAQLAGKTVVAVVTVETIVLSIDKLFEKLSDALSGSGTENVLTPADPLRAPYAQENAEFLRNLGTDENFDPSRRTAFDLLGSHEEPPARIPQIPEVGASAVPATLGVDLTPTEVPNTPESFTLDPDSVIGKGEGIEHSLQRQIIKNPEMFGYEGEDNAQAIKEFAGREAHRQAIEMGYVGEGGQEVRIAKPGVAYQFEIKDGKVAGIMEFDETGQPTGTRAPGGVFEGIEGDADELEKYEYLHQGGEATSGETPASQVDQTELRDKILQALDGRIEPLVEITTESPTPEMEMQTIDNPNIGDAEKTLTPDQVLGDTYHPLEPERPGTYRPYNAPDESMIKRDFNPEHGTYRPYNNPFGPVGNMDVVSEQILGQVNNIFESNIAHIFPNDTEEVWSMLKEMPADATIELEADPTEKGMNSFIAYLRKLHDITGLSPNTETLIRPAETNTEFIKRALQKTAEMGQLEKVKL